MRMRGYTLIELLVVLAVLGLLATMVMPLAQMTVERQREAELKLALWTIRDALDTYKAARLAGALGPVDPGDPSPPFPPSLQVLTQAVPDARPSHRGEMLRFLRRVPRDPFADTALADDQTWGLRSYESDADHPRAGANVYDVYSKASGAGLNGVALSQW